MENHSEEYSPNLKNKLDIFRKPDYLFSDKSNDTRMETLIESMTKFEQQTYADGLVTIRVWREEETYDNTTEDQTRTDIYKLLRNVKAVNLNRVTIASMILEMDRVNAVEVLNPNGNGVVLYRVAIKVNGVSLI